MRRSIGLAVEVPVDAGSTGDAAPAGRLVTVVVDDDGAGCQLSSECVKSGSGGGVEGEAAAAAVIGAPHRAVQPFQLSGRRDHGMALP